MTANRKLISIFPVPVYTTTLDVDEELKQSVIHLEFADIDSRNGKMTTTKYLLDQPGFEKLAEMIDTEVQEYARNIFQQKDSIEFFRTTSWAMKHEQGDWSNSHSHLNSIISGICYLQVDENSGELTFNKIINNLYDGVIDITTSGWNPFNSHSFTIVPENNQLVIFPSNLPHKVSPSRSSNSRYCIAFNYFVRGLFGQNEGELKIS